MKASTPWSRDSNDGTWVANAKFILFCSIIPSMLAEASASPEPPVFVPVPVHVHVQLPVQLNSTLCKGHCVDDCKSYLTPLRQCFNGQALFANDPSWGDYDVQDVTVDWSLSMFNDSDNDVNSTLFVRYFFGSKDGNCTGEPTDSFTLPIHECVGPFGAPRPWGEFSYVDADADSPKEER
jgi:hypothetical protein